jgi:hypothetical protein
MLVPFLRGECGDFDFLATAPPHSQHYSPATSLGGIITHARGPRRRAALQWRPQMPSLKFNSRRRWRATIPLAAIIPSILASCFTLFGAQKTNDTSWETADWTEWTLQDCNTVIGSSPWVHATAPSTNGQPLAFNSGVRLESALPIRQANLRSLQLSSKYDKMTPDKKQEFDQAHAHDLDPTDKITIFIWSIAFDDSQHPTALSDPATQAALRLMNGQLVLPLQTILPEKNPSDFNNSITEVTYVFPRTVAGRPLYSPNDLFLIMEHGGLLVIDKKTHQPTPTDFRSSGRANLFKISDLMYKGNLEY